MEKWRDIPGYRGLQASSQGRIKALKCVIKCQNGQKRVLREKILTPVLHNTGYHIVCFCRNGGQKTILVHRLVLLAFQGFPLSGQESCHNNGNKTDNRIENLRWDTRQNNLLDRRKHHTDPIGERNPFSKLTKELIIKIRKDPRSQRKVALDYKISQAHVQRIKSNKSWSHVI